MLLLLLLLLHKNQLPHIHVSACVCIHTKHVMGQATHYIRLVLEPSFPLQGAGAQTIITAATLYSFKLHSVAFMQLGRRSWKNIYLGIWMSVDRTCRSNQLWRESAAICLLSIKPKNIFLWAAHDHMCNIAPFTAVVHILHLQYCKCFR